MFDAPSPPSAALLQDPAFATALRLCGAPPVVLPGGLIVLHRRIMGLHVAMLPRAIPPADLTDQLRGVGLHRLPLLLSPEERCKIPRAMPLRKPRQIALLDLQVDGNTRLARLHPKWRNQWRRAQASDLHIAHGALAADPQHPLLRAETQQRQHRGYTGWPAPLTAAFASAAPDQTRLFTARHKGRIIAQMLFLLHGTAATYHIGHTTAAGRARHAHNFLLIAACDWLSVTGHRSLDLGLLDPRTPDLNRFKLRTGAQVQTTGGTWLRWHPLARGVRL